MDTYGSQELKHQPPSIPGHDPVRCLGSGAQGQVWLMSPRDGSAAVAAKFLVPPSDPGGGDMNGALVRHNASQITQEWRVLTQFQHDHLIPVRRVVADSNGAQVLLMDFAAGGSLAQIVHAKGPLTVGETVTVLTPMGQVLAYLHGRGAVHGDVSAGNILLSAAGKPYLSDFGLGRLLGQGAGPPAGTPGFYCSADVDRDEASDVYALAAVGWFALTGRPAPPTRERMPLGTFVQDIPSELVAALEAGLNENAAQRPSAAAFAQAVFRSARAEPVALGNAVHPSVLPELLTRKEVKARSRKRRRTGPRLFCWRRPQRLPREVRAERRSVRHQDTEGGMRALPRRRHQGLAAGMAWASEAGVVRRPRVRWVKKVAAGAVAAAVTVLLAVAVFNGGVFGAQGFGAGPESSVNQLAKPSAGSEIRMAWAAALPAAIQEGLAAQEPVAALHALAWVRSYALSTADDELMAEINVPGSAAYEADMAVVQALKDRGHTLTGLETSISAASTVFGQVPLPASDSGSAADPLKATVRATVTTSAFAEQDADGTLVHRQMEEQQQELEVILARVDARWAIQDVLAAAAK